MPFPSPPPARAGARAPVRYCPELGEAICARIATGESVLAIGDDPAMPCSTSIHNWARRYDEFRRMYMAAKAISADLMFDLAREIALETTEATVRSDALRIRTLRWHVALVAPKKYGLRRALGPAFSDGDGEGGGTIMNVIIRNFGDPEPGAPQFFNLAGEEAPRPAHGQGWRAHENGPAVRGRRGRVFGPEAPTCGPGRWSGCWRWWRRRRRCRPVARSRRPSR